MAKASVAKKTKAKSKASRKAAKMPARKKAGKKTKAKKTKAKKAKAKKATKTVKKKTATKKKTSKKVTRKAGKKKTSTARRASSKSARAARPNTQEIAARIANDATTSQPMPITQEQNALSIGDLAPDFNLPDQNGQFHSLQQYRGKNVVLYFYPKDDTPGCTREACSFRDNLQSFTNRNTVILGISLDDTDSHRKFVEKYDLNFPLLSDTEKEVAQAYGVYGPKNMYGKTYMGIDRSTFVIDREGRIVAIFRSVKVDGHTEEVQAEIEKLS